MRFFQAEWCLFSHLVRAKLTELGRYKHLDLRTGGLCSSGHGRSGAKSYHEVVTVNRPDQTNS
jgi:hypothetical protein